MSIAALLGIIFLQPQNSQVCVFATSYLCGHLNDTEDDDDPPLSFWARGADAAAAVDGLAARVRRVHGAGST